MKRAQLLHNPGAGSGGHAINELLALIEANGFECSYSSVKEEGWKDIKDETELLIIAGGDGTVKKVVNVILGQNKTHLPIALLPLGTANNIASALKLEGKEEDIIHSWKNDKRQKYDVGKLSSAENTSFFFESFGYGLFPYLIDRMSKRNHEGPETPEQGKLATLKMLNQLIPSYDPFDCNVMTDGNDYSGKYFLAEIMITRSIGPNLVLSPYSNLDDAVFDVVLLSGNDKEKLSSYARDKMSGRKGEYDFTSVKAKKIAIRSAATDVHVDDELIRLSSGAGVKVEIMPAALEFLIL